jgi:aminopeptidase N
MITYLATASIGRFELDRSRLAGIESVVAVDPHEARAARRALRPMARIMRFFASRFGSYPFRDAGAVVDHLRNGPTALETQTRPSYPQAPGRTTVAHEIAHQWFGDSVSIADNSQIWLNEGFATWAEWRWRQERGGETTRQAFRRFRRVPAGRSGFWNPPPAAVSRPKRLFATSIYVRGAMTLEALRRRIGNRAFYATLRGWVRRNEHGSGTTEKFVALAEARSDRRLTGFFDRWLYRRGRP